MSEEEKTIEESSSTTPKEDPLPPEVDAFLKGKNKYKHPYGAWRPVEKSDSLKRKDIGELLDLPADNWYLPENQPAPVVQEVKDPHMKLDFKEREVPGIPSKSNEPVAFKKRKVAANRQLRGASDKKDKVKNEPEES